MSEHDHVEILLVEDNPYDAEMTIEALTTHNFVNKLHWVKDGEAALDFIGCTGGYADRNPSESPKLILLDLKMPKVDGLDVLRALKGSERTSSIPVVIMTSSSQERDVVESYRLGSNAYVIKPVDFEQFSEAVLQLGLFWLLVNKAPPIIGDQS